MYNHLSKNLFLGFCGCNTEAAEDALEDRRGLVAHTSIFSLLGNGVYFWQNNMEKAQEWAEKYCNHYNSVWPEKISFTPAIIGAVIDLGYSLNLTDYENFSTIRMGYDALLNKEWEQKHGISGNEHKLVYKSDADFIDRIHDYLTIKKMKQYDSVIAEYKDGKILCEKPQSKEGVETLICIRNPNCIKGYFKPSYQNFLYPSV